MNVLYSIRDTFMHLVQVSEVRMVAPDDIPMSQAKGTSPMIGIHTTWYRKHAQIVAALPKIEKALEKFNVKPHFGKLFCLSGERFEALYGQDLEILRSLITFHDPTGKFRNEWMDKYIFCSSRWKAIVNKSVLPEAKL
jgi:xylitol oxidase